MGYHSIIAIIAIAKPCYSEEIGHFGSEVRLNICLSSPVKEVIVLRRVTPIRTPRKLITGPARKDKPVVG